MLPDYSELKEKGVLNYEKFEQKRLAGKAKSKKGFLFGAIFGLIFSIIAIFIYTKSFTFWAIVVFIVGAIVFLFIWVLSNISGMEALKKTIFPDILKQIDPDFLYEVSDLIKKQAIIDSLGFDDTSGINIDDVFTGKMNGNNFTITDLRQKVDRGNYKEVSFNGVFATIEYDFDLPMTLVTKKEFTDKPFAISAKNVSIIKLNNEDFDESFIVETTDENSAKMVLNLNFIEYLKELGEKHEISIAWNKTQIIVADNTHQDMFELDLSSPITDETILKFYNQLKDYYEILENVFSFITKGDGIEELSNDEQIPPDEPENN